MGRAFDPGRVLSDLDALARLTSDDGGAQRLTWTEPWWRARDWLRRELAALPVEIEQDAAHNLWATLPGADSRSLVIGSHLDSVPGGGPLDGCLGVLAGLEILRRLAAAGEPPVTVRLVDWAEEEGDQSGHSLLGSTAAAGHLDTELLRSLTSWQGRPVPELLAEQGVEIDAMPGAHAQLAGVRAYLELHIEQSVRLERAGLPIGVVTGTAGVERHQIVYSGRRDHPARPMDDRADALMAIARFVVALRELVAADGGSTLTGQLELKPNVPLVVADEASAIFDVRAFDADALGRIDRGWRALAERIAREEHVSVRSQLRWRIDPAPFDRALMELADEAVADVGGGSTRLGSPQLHDAGEMARAGVPTAMLFVQSIGGVSHSPHETSHEEHLRLALRAFDVLTDKTIAHLCAAIHEED